VIQTSTFLPCCWNLYAEERSTQHPVSVHCCRTIGSTDKEHRTSKESRARNRRRRSRLLATPPAGVAITCLSFTIPPITPSTPQPTRFKLSHSAAAPYWKGVWPISPYHIHTITTPHSSTLLLHSGRQNLLGSATREAPTAAQRTAYVPSAAA
jgi:hypothetical protein